MGEHQHLGIVDAAQRDAEKIADADIDGHLHAEQRTAQDHALAMKFDLPHAAVRADVVRIESYRQSERVEPQYAARPDGIGPACWCLTPHGFYLPAGIILPVDA